MSAALAAVRAKGAAVVIATGRPAQAAMSILQQVGGHVDFLLCSNGGWSRRRDCHFTGTPSPSLLKDLLPVEGGATE